MAGRCRLLPVDALRVHRGCALMTLHARNAQMVLDASWCIMRPAIVRVGTFRFTYATGSLFFFFVFSRACVPPGTSFSAAGNSGRRCMSLAGPQPPRHPTSALPIPVRPRCAAWRGHGAHSLQRGAAPSAGIRRSSAPRPQRQEHTGNGGHRE